jgi:hypothetical protein
MRRTVAKLLVAALLGAAAAGLVACGSSGNGLIPAAQAGPLQVDIEAVERAAEEGAGNCSATEAALLKTDQDYAALPRAVNATLRGKLRLGIENLHKVAREACAQPLAGTTTATTPKTPAPSTTQTTTTPKPTTTATTPTTPAPPVHEHEEAEHPTGGGTAAPGESESPGGATPEEGAAGNGASGNGAGGSEGK